MAAHTYYYSISQDFPNGTVNDQRFRVELGDAGITGITSINIGLIPTADLAGTPVPSTLRGSTPVDLEDRLDIVAVDEFSSAELTIIDGDTAGPSGGLIALHPQEGSEPPDIVPGQGHVPVDDVDGDPALPPIDGSQVLGVEPGVWYAEDLGGSCRTSVYYARKVRLELEDIKAGWYFIRWYCECEATTSYYAGVRARIQVDGETVAEVDPRRVDEWYSDAGWALVELGAGHHDIDMDWAATHNGYCATIRRSKLIAQKVKVLNG